VKLVPERWVPVRILRGHLAGAGLTAEVAYCGEGVVLSGPGLPGGPLVCRLDRRGPAGSVLDEPLAQAACGLMAVHGLGRGRRAARLGVDYVTTAVGVVLAQGVLAGLLARLRGGTLRGVTVSMAATALLTVSQYLAAGTADEPERPARTEPGQPPPFRSADGVTFELEPLYPEPWRVLWTSLGVPDRVADQAWRPFVLRYATAVAPLPAALHAATQTRPFAELARAAATAGVAVQRLRSHEECNPGICRCTPFAAPWTVEPIGPAAVPGSPAPGSGGGPLAGMVVVEAGRRVQAPLAGHLLGMLGAEVISIEPTGGDILRRVPPMAGDCSARFWAFNRGKRLVEAELWNPAGRRTVVDAVAQADVFLHNWPPGKAARLGLDHDRLAAVNPRLVFAHASGWGDALGANPPPGTEFMVQAYAGLPDHLTPAGEAPAGSLMTLLDVLGGLVAASGVLAGLVGREQDGRPRRVRSSLLCSAALLQAQLGERGPNGRPEFGAFGVPLPAVDGDLVLSRTAPPPAVTTAFGVSELTEVPAAIAASPVTESLQQLAAAGVDAVRACTDPGELADDPWATTLLHRDRCAFVLSPWVFTA
jgi:crotonobetainyl-CoA:carnitine CoA-transferase CaiB-like acyl-CoA transferase